MDRDHDYILNALANELTTGGPRGRPLHRRLASLDKADGLIYRAVREGMAGLLYLYMRKTRILGLLDEALNRRLAQTYYHAVQNQLRLEAELTKVLKKMAARDLSVVLLQGISLQNDVYQTPGQRPMYDIDMWVLPAHFKSFSRLLHSFGYLPDELYPHTFRKGAVVFDIHTHLLWADRIKARQHLLAVAQEKLFREAECFQIADQPARRLNPYDQVLYLGLHALKHNLERLIWLVDIQLIVSDMTTADWRKLFERAQVLGQSRTLAQILYLLDDLLEMPLPDIAIDFLQKQDLSTIEKWVLRRRKQSGRLPGWATLVLFPAGMQRGRWHLVWETLFPRPEIVKQGFPDAAECSRGRFYIRRFLLLLKYAVGKAPLAPVTGHS